MYHEKAFNTARIRDERPNSVTPLKVLFHVVGLGSE